MRRWTARRLDDLATLDLSGYVLKKDSPSCGMERVKVYRSGGGMPARRGRGVFAAALMERLPLLPVEEEGRLCDPRLRESFIERVFAYRRLRALFAAPWTIGRPGRRPQAHKIRSAPARATCGFGRLVPRRSEFQRGELRARSRAVNERTGGRPHRQRT